MGFYGYYSLARIIVNRHISKYGNELFYDYNVFDELDSFIWKGSYMKNHSKRIIFG
jgi:hypothetical protein